MNNYIMNNQLFLILNHVATLLPAFLLVLTFRGFFRTLSAKLMGDDTPSREGFMSLNPLAFVDIIKLMVGLFILGAISSLLGPDEVRNFIFLGLIFIAINWSYTIPIHVSNFKNIKLGMVVTSVFGSIGNFFLALIFLYILKYFPFSYLPAYMVQAFSDVFSSVVKFAIFFGVIYLLPLPPFDGFGVLEALAPMSWRRGVEWLEEKSLYVFVIFILLSDVIFIILNPINAYIYQFLTYLVF